MGLSSLTTALIVLACVCSGAVLGAAIRGRLPEAHLRDDSRDVLKLASGMIATLVALVIGLLVSSAKSSYDQAGAGVTQIGARVILLDRILARYGPETKEIRARVGQGVARALDHLWPKAPDARPDLLAMERATSMEEAQEGIAALEPRDEPRRVLRTQALAVIADLSQSRWMMLEQAQTTLPGGFLAMLIFWLTVLFASLGLLAPRNRTTLGSLLVCAMSMASAIYLILEMNRPLQGVIQISPAPLLKALSVIGR